MEQIALPLPEVLAVVQEYIRSGRLDAAERLLGHVRTGAPGHAQALQLSGYVAFKQRRVADAVALMEAGLSAGAVGAQQLGNLAEAYRIAGRLDDGVAMARRAQAMAPSDAAYHFTEAMLRYDRQELDLCIRAARRAVALKPDMAEAHMRLGQALLASGDYAEGWAEYEWRYRIAEAQPLLPPGLPLASRHAPWDGTPLSADRTLLLVADQGFGDVMMFARFLPWAMARCADVALACSGEMLGLLRRAFPGPRTLTQWQDARDCAVHCPLSGLPRLAGVAAGALPGGIPYLSADPARRAGMAEWLAAATPRARLRVGLAWAGRTSHPNDRNRSMRLDMLRPLLATEGAALVSLQKGEGAPPARTPLLDASAMLQDFEDTAALVDCLDLVVAVDTAVAHLAGALGKPVWVLLPFAPDWRWMTGRPDSPWYPTCRLYRQSSPGAWADPVAAAAADLRDLASIR